jgi:alpha-tubulin suppressor-like RCC1 family protein
MLRTVTSLVCLATMAAACAGGSSNEGHLSGGTCTVTDNGDHTFTMECPDDTRVTWTEGTPGIIGEDGDPCTVTNNKDGTYTMRCPDDTTVTWRDGEPGAEGADGAAATPCTVADNGDGSYTLACPDGAPVTWRDGEIGPVGPEGPEGPGGATGEPGQNALPCVVVDNEDGSYTMTCPDGTNVTWHDGESPAPCTVAANGDGSYTMICPDGSVTWHDGEIGPVGPEGPEGPGGATGEPGQNALPCVVVDNEDGSYTMTCPDGTNVTWHDGETPAPCTVAANGDGSYTMICPDGSVTWHDGEIGPVGPVGPEGPEGPGGATGEPGQNALPCVVVDNEDGSYTMTCPDGTNVTWHDGESPAPCTVAANGDGSYTMTCPDGSVTWHDGEIGPVGPVGPEGPEGPGGATGEPGQNALPCVVVDNEDGSYTMTCPDGTNVTWHDGESPAPCTVAANGDGSYTMTCPDGNVTWHDGEIGPVGPEGPEGPGGATGEPGQNALPCVVVDNEDGSYTMTCPDGTSVTWHDGETPAPCTVAANGGGSYTMTCTDGTSVTWHDGESPAPCAVADNGDGSYTMTCADGTSATWTAGGDGTSCNVQDNGDGSYTLTCPDGTSVTWRGDGGEGPCVPRSCADLGHECGSWPDGCGGETGECGPCAAALVCVTGQCRTPGDDEMDPLCVAEVCTDDVCEDVVRPDGAVCGFHHVCQNGLCVAQPAPARYSMALGSHHAVAVRADGTVMAWGRNNRGQLGTGQTRDVPRTHPVDVADLTDVVGVTTGAEFSCAWDAAGAAYCWGQGGSGQIGDGGLLDRPLPTTVVNVAQVVQMSAGDAFVCALTASGQVYCWGTNGAGQLGIGVAGGSREVPQPVANLADAAFLSAGRAHVCAIRTAGQLVCWGHGGSGRLGTGDTASQTTPTAVLPGPAELRDARDVVASASHTCAARSDGRLACWGSATSGRLGGAAASSVTTPHLVPETAALTAVAALIPGADHSCALVASGGLACWGRNVEGQLGQGTVSTGNAVPTLVNDLPPIEAAAGGDTATCGRTAAGDIFCWGDNTYGTLGDGTTALKAAPAAVVGREEHARCPACDDGNPCTEVFCVDGGCVPRARPDGARCGRARACQSGICAPAAAPLHTLAVGSAHVLFARDDGSVASWGHNARGQLGVPSSDVTFLTKPIDVPGLTGVVGVTAGAEFSCAWTDGGVTYCWGAGASGQLGDGGLADRAHPTPVSGLSAVVQVAAGAEFACALRENGQVYCWGSNVRGQMGSGTLGGTVNTPLAVAGLTDAAILTAGPQHVCAISARGRVLCWGAGGSGRLGYGQTSDQARPLQVAPGPALLFDAREVTASGTHTCAQRTDGRLTCWGSATANRLAGASAVAETVPHLVPVTDSLEGVLTLLAGLEHTCALRQDGALACWGRNASGQLGIGTLSTSSLPVVIPAFGPVTTAAAGDTSTCARTEEGQVYCWGQNVFGALGDGTTTDRTSPREVVQLADHALCAECDDGNPCTRGFCTPAGCLTEARPDGAVCGYGRACAAGACNAGEPPATTLAVGSDHVLFARADGSVAAWGQNQHGQLGIGTTSTLPRVYPVDVVGLSEIVGVAAGEDFSCAWTGDGRIFCWGLGTSGQIGDGASANRAQPTPVNAWGQPTVQVVAGRGFACALDATGQVHCWGTNLYGQLGLGTTGGQETTPTPVLNLADAAYLDAGDQHICAIRRSGQLVCWGAGSQGRLGYGETGNRPRPTAVAPGLAGIADVRRVAAGSQFTCAERMDGRLSCWGSATYSKLAGAAAETLLVPGLAPQVAGLETIDTLLAGAEHGCAQLTDGRLSCWGRNNYGQLGNGSLTNSAVPTPVPGLADVTAAAAGRAMTCAAVAGGGVYCWGENTNGTLGDGTRTDRSTPAPVIRLAAHALCAECDDGNPCTRGFCTPEGCLEEARPDSAVCGIGRECDGGVCRAVPQPEHTLGVGDQHAVFVRDDGTVVSFGGNTAGRLGTGETWTLYRTYPDEVHGLHDIVGTAVGGDFSCVWDVLGQVYCWGDGTVGQLGRGNLLASPTPALVSGLGEIVQVAAGGRFACALRGDGLVSCWGHNTYGQLGRGTTGGESATAQAVAGFSQAVALSAGEHHICALRADGRAFCWGRGTSGRIGHGLDTNTATPAEVLPGTAQLTEVRRILAAQAHTCAERVDGRLACWGSGSYARLAGASDVAVNTAMLVPDYPALRGIAQLIPGGEHSCALGADGVLACWGRNHCGQLGVGTTTQSAEPQPVTGVGVVRAAAAGPGATCALDTLGLLSCWGCNDLGGLGHGTLDGAHLPAPVIGLRPYGLCPDCEDLSVCTYSMCLPEGGCEVELRADGLPCEPGVACADGLCAAPDPRHRALVAGTAHTCVLRPTDGALRCFGDGLLGQLGDGLGASSATPRTVVGLDTALSLASQGDHTCALSAGGDVFCWGAGANGQLGDGGTSDALSPGLVSLPEAAVAVAAGGRHSCAVLESGAVRCWGSQQYGALGNGATVAAAVVAPTPVLWLGDALDMWAGGNQSCALRDGGRLVCWGQNSAGGIGDGTTTHRGYPVEVAPGAAELWRARRLVTGAEHACVVSDEGAVFCWGRNAYSQLGLPDIVNRRLAEPIAELADGVWTVAASADHTCALLEDGTVRCWGRNTHGQLGLGNTATRVAHPTAVPGLTGVAAIACGALHTCALTAAGTLYCWGANPDGRLGFDTGGASVLDPTALPAL